MLHQAVDPAVKVNPDKTWNEEIVWETAAPTDVQCVLQTLIPSNEAIDQLIWPYTDEGRVTVWSAYHIIREAQYGGADTLNRNGDMSKIIWSVVWKVDILPKVKNFMRKLLSNSLLVMQNLRR